MPAKKSAALSANQARLIAKALADPRRLEILKQIAACAAGASCTDVRESQDVTAATLSHHLKELETAGLIEITRKGKFAEMKLCRDALESYIGALKCILKEEA